MSRSHAHRGPPPCQRPDCTNTAHVRTDYTLCLDHDEPPFVAPPESLETTGIATDSFRFYFGASCGSSRKTLRQLEEPNVILSYATRSNKPWDAIESFFIDSGGYSLVAKGEGTYPDSIDDYLDYVEAHNADWFASRDVPIADRVMRNFDGDVADALYTSVIETIETIEAARERDIDAQPIAILQGQTASDYVDCYQQFVKADCVTSRLGIGSLKGYSPEETAILLEDIDREIDADVEYHGFGVDVPDLEYASTRRILNSADSSRYIATARWRGNRDEHPPNLRDDEPKSGWHETARAYFDMRADLRETLAADPMVSEIAHSGQQTQLVADD